MSGLYALGVIVLWIALNFGLWKAWRRIRQGAGKNRRRVDTAFAVFALTWLSISFWYGGGRKFYYDAEVRQLCAIDGGVKVYETVKLPVERFDQYGNVGITNRGYAQPTDEYFFETADEYLRTGDPTLVRSVTRIIRRSDNKILGESIRYGRGGGDVPGPWHPSTFDCPSIKELRLETSIFISGVKK